MGQKGVFGARLKRLSDGLAKARLEGVIMVPGPNMRYLTGVRSLLLERPFMLFVGSDGQAGMVAPELEAGPYRECGIPVAIESWTDSQGSDGAVRRAANTLKLRGRWGVEGRVPYMFLHKLLEHASLRMDDAEPILQGLREVKDEAEIRLLKRSAAILSRSFEEFPQIIAEGKTELQLAREASGIIYSKGAAEVEEPLVQSGQRAADPHSLPSARKVRRGESIVFDIASTFDGYYADITRTFCLGESKEVRAVYERVLEAETKAIAAAAEGVQVGRVDAAARNSLMKAGLGKHFIHRTGHGLGLEVHEAPYVVEGGKERLLENECFTIEPGVYIPGKLGVRMEDNVLIERRKGVEITSPPKEFGWWK